MTPAELLSLLLECSIAAASNLTSINPACPALAPPPGELPLDPNAASLWSHSVGVLAACCALVCLSLALRMFTRSYITKRRFALEDGKPTFVSALSNHKANTSPALMIIAVVGLRLIKYYYSCV
jgi:Na+/phosphate symporter